MKINKPSVYTTGKIAKLCSVSIRTVARWIESDHLRAYRLPGDSTEYRVTKSDLLEFMQKYGLPHEHILDLEPLPILLIDDDPETIQTLSKLLKKLDRNLFLITARTVLEAALKIGFFEPRVLLIGFNALTQNSTEELELIGALTRVTELARTNIIALTSSDKISGKVSKELKHYQTVTLMRKPIQSTQLSKILAQFIS